MAPGEDQDASGLRGWKCVSEDHMATVQSLLGCSSLGIYCGLHQPTPKESPKETWNAKSRPTVNVDMQVKRPGLDSTFVRLLHIYKLCSHAYVPQNYACVLQDDVRTVQ